MHRMELSSSRDNEENRAPLQSKHGDPVERQLDRFRRTVNKFEPQGIAVDDDASYSARNNPSESRVVKQDGPRNGRHVPRAHMDAARPIDNRKALYTKSASASYKQAPNRGREPVFPPPTDPLSLDESFAAWKASEMSERSQERTRSSSKSTPRKDHGKERQRSSSRSAPAKKDQINDRRYRSPSQYHADARTDDRGSKKCEWIRDTRHRSPTRHHSETTRNEHNMERKRYSSESTTREDEHARERHQRSSSRHRVEADSLSTSNRSHHRAEVNSLSTLKRDDHSLSSSKRDAHTLESTTRKEDHVRERHQRASSRHRAEADCLSTSERSHHRAEADSLSASNRSHHCAEVDSLSISKRDDHSLSSSKRDAHTLESTARKDDNVRERHHRASSRHRAEADCLSTSKRSHHRAEADSSSTSKRDDRSVSSSKQEEQTKGRRQSFPAHSRTGTGKMEQNGSSSGSTLKRGEHARERRHDSPSHIRANAANKQRQRSSSVSTHEREVHARGRHHRSESESHYRVDTKHEGSKRSSSASAHKREERVNEQLDTSLSNYPSKTASRGRPRSSSTSAPRKVEEVREHLASPPYHRRIDIIAKHERKRSLSASITKKKQSFLADQGTNTTSDKTPMKTSSTSKPTKRSMLEALSPIQSRPSVSIPVTMQSGSNSVRPPPRSVNDKIARLYVPLKRRQLAPQPASSYPPSSKLFAPVVPIEEVLAKVSAVVSAMEESKQNEFTAATIIQSALRSSNARHSYSFVRNALLIQRTWRGSHPRLAFKLHRDAATMIAKAWKAHTGRESYKLHSNSRKIQTAWRCYVPRMQYLQYLRTFRAATIMQTTWRSFKCSSDYTAEMKSIQTAQRVCRGYTHRKTFHLLSDEREYKRLRQRSALNIQRTVRGWLSKKECATIRYKNKLHRSAAIIQSYWRRYDVEERFWYTLGCVITLQCFARTLVAHGKYAERLGSIIVSQSILRRWLAKQQYKRMIETDRRQKATIKIQTMLRMAIATMKYKLQLRARTIQTAWRRHVPRTTYLRHVETVCASTKIQSAWRSFTCYVDFLYTLRSILLIQRIARGHMARNLFAAKLKKRDDDRAYFLLLNRSATDIQRAFRGAQGRSECRRLRRKRQRNNAAVAIQSSWHGYVEQQKYWITLGSVIQIQTLVRAKLARNRYLDDLGCIIISQCMMRGWIARKQKRQMSLIAMLMSKANHDLSEKKAAVKKLQSWYRLTVKPKLLNRAIVKVQSFFRMVKAMVDLQIMIEVERRRRRKHIKNSSKYAVDELLLDDAWDSLTVPKLTIKAEGEDRSGGRQRKRSVFERSSPRANAVSRKTAQKATQKAAQKPMQNTACDDLLEDAWDSISVMEPKEPPKEAKTNKGSTDGPRGRVRGKSATRNLIPKVPASPPRKRSVSRDSSRRESSSQRVKNKRSGSCGPSASRRSSPKSNLPPKPLLPPSFRSEDVDYDERPTDVIRTTRRYDHGDESDAISEISASTASNFFFQQHQVTSAMAAATNEQSRGTVAKPKSKLASKGISHMRAARTKPVTRPSKRSLTMRHLAVARSRSMRHVETASSRDQLSVSR